MTVRPCLDCGALTNATRCPTHTNARRQAKYGGTHQAERRRWTPQVATGRVLCPRCGLPIAPGDEWDLGHQPDGTRHPEHACCNRSAGGAGTP